MRYPIDVVFLDRAGCIRKLVPHLKPWRPAACLVAGESQRLGLVVGESIATCLTPCHMEHSA
ncbi:MAG: DUF192 domain-containing protein [Opitutaceae bacterium]|nr:DUF192 domain-containing protein [Opitutaceae bacterium]